MKFPFPQKLNDIAVLTGAEVIGNNLDLVTGINEIHKVETGDITFVDHSKYYDKALQSNASFVIINKNVEPPAGKALLFHEDPFSVYIRIVQQFRSFQPSANSISESAVIGKGTI